MIQITWQELRRRTQTAPEVNWLSFFFQDELGEGWEPGSLMVKGLRPEVPGWLGCGKCSSGSLLTGFLIPDPLCACTQTHTCTYMHLKA